ncbi:MAG TPA: hypothetical protein VGU61_07315 [Noviherbaspirillum sp.]|nr:hypothetical protein [Noviherbaspirillum sp.]
MAEGKAATLFSAFSAVDPALPELSPVAMPVAGTMTSDRPEGRVGDTGCCALADVAHMQKSRPVNVSNPEAARIFMKTPTVG